MSTLTLNLASGCAIGLHPVAKPTMHRLTPGVVLWQHGSNEDMSVSSSVVIPLDKEDELICLLKAAFTVAREESRGQ